MNPNHIRTVRLQPYRKDMGPRFILAVSDTYRRDHLGKSILAYAFSQHNEDGTKVALFSGSDFACSPMCAIDSDECLACLLGFLCLRKGDTDAEYFANYTPEQTEFSETHAETLQGEVSARFGEY